MELSPVFEHISSYALTKRSQRVFATDKKTGCVYHIVYRCKHNRRFEDDNTESLELEIDPNLSPSFSVEEVDLVSGRSITCNLTRLTQPRIGNTVLTMSIFHIDEHQELRETIRTFSIPTNGGSITKRLELALVAFHKQARAVIADFNAKGFDNEVTEKASYYASYIVMKAQVLDRQRHIREPKILSDVWSNYDQTALNIMLYLYSMLNSFSLHEEGTICSYADHFIQSRNGAWHPRKHLYTAQEMVELDAIMEYYRTNQEMLLRTFNDCQDGWNFNEQRLTQTLKIRNEDKL